MSGGHVARNASTSREACGFTLTAVYTIVFTLLLVAVSLFFRQNLASNLDQGAREDLDQNWAIVKAYLRIEGDPAQNDYHAKWFNDEK